MSDESKKQTSLVSIDLCAGAGGLSLGFLQAGFDVVAAVENDSRAAAIHKRNFPRCKIIEKSIVGLDATDLRKQAGIGNREIAVVFGGPPCQGFSVMGRRNREDERSKILVEFARLAVALKPQVIVAENVKGILMHWAKERREEFEEIVGKSGYVLLDPWILNAADYGVPQRRERVFLVAVMSDMAHPTPPKVADGYVAPTVWDAIGDLAGIGDVKGRALLSGDIYSGPLGRPSPYAKRLREAVGTAELTCCALPVHSPEVSLRFGKTPNGATEEVSRFFRLPKDGFAATLRAGTGPDKGSYMACRPIHPSQARCITVREAARLHGFPDCFRFDPEHWHGFRQIGNSVPPPLARKVAEAILSSLEQSYA